MTFDNVSIFAYRDELQCWHENKFFEYYNERLLEQ